MGNSSAPLNADARDTWTLHARAARQAALAAVGLLALGKLDVKTLLGEAVSRFREALGADTCTVLELLPDGKALSVAAAIGWNEEVIGTHLVDAGRFSQAGYTLLSSEPVVVEDTALETRFAIAPLLIRHQIQSGMTVIIHGRDKPYGVLGVQSKKIAAFSKEDLDYFQSAANVIASAIDRLRTEGELRRSEESFRSLIEHAPEGILISYNRVIVYANRALATYLGYETNELLLGKSALEVVHPDDRDTVIGRLHTIDNTLTAAAPKEIRFLRRDGTSVLAESIGVPIVFDGKQCIAALVRDVAERKQMEARLFQSERLTSLGTLAAGVAHEINNPLSYLIGNLDLIRQSLSEAITTQCPAELSDPKWITEQLFGLRSHLADLFAMLEEARSGAERVRRIVADLKTFSRAKDEASAPVDVRAVMDSSINMARNEIRHRAELIVEYDDVPAVLANESRLGQVFLNLLLNAAQAIPEGDVQKNCIAVRAYHSEDRVFVEVKDTGLGIPEEIQNRLFDPFFTTKPVGEGTGLGLAICHNIIASFGGEITVESGEGAGSCFRVSLKSTSKTARPSEPAPQIAAEIHRGRILIIDDEPFVANVWRRILARDHEVEAVTSGDAALKKIETGADFDVILCDLMMPEMSGMQFFAILTQRDQALAERVIFVSGGAFTPAAQEFRERSQNLFLDKPCEPERLREAVRQHVVKRRST